MSKIFNVGVGFEGTITYTIEADSEDEAKEKAENMFADERNDHIGTCVTDYEVEKCVEQATEVTEITEFCPHCGTEITIMWNIRENGYKVFCPKCGNILMLCSMCLEDNTKCDWSDENKGCFRTKGD